MEWVSSVGLLDTVPRSSMRSRGPCGKQGRHVRAWRCPGLDALDGTARRGGMVDREWILRLRALISAARWSGDRFPGRGIDRCVQLGHALHKDPRLMEVSRGAVTSVAFSRQPLEARF